MKTKFLDDDYVIETKKYQMKPGYQKNVKNFDCTMLSKDDYDKAVVELMHSKVDNKNIFGYVTDKQEYKKYNKDLMLLVVYNGKNKIIKSCPATWRAYSGNKYDDYADELYER